jgi:hypothetical protein
MPGSLQGLSRTVMGIVIFSVVLFGIAPSGTSQEQPGLLKGTVKIQGAGPAAGASVTLSSMNVRRTAKTDASGGFEFEAVEAGRYDLNVAGTGVRNYHRPGIQLAAGEPLVLELTVERAAEADGIGADRRASCRS